MSRSTALKDFLHEHRHTAEGSIGRVISPVIQHSALGAFGGMGDFVRQTSKLFPQIEWVLPLTRRIRNHVGEALGPFVTEVPVELFDPVTGEGHRFDFRVHYHRQANGSLAWLLDNEDLLEPLAAYKTVLEADRSGRPPELHRVHRFYNVLINQHSYQQFDWTFEHFTVANTPELGRIHPLLRRYIHNPDILQVIAQCAVAKAVAGLMMNEGADYDVVWVHDWHFAALAGELMLPSRSILAEKVLYVQHLHNALHQGIYGMSELVDLLGWPESHLTDRLYRVHGQLNLLGGALNALRFGLLNGRAVAVSRNHANELTTVERGAGLHHIFAPLHKAGRLTGVNNPITVPSECLIANESDIETAKPGCKEMVQRFFRLKVRSDSLLLLWSHRFTHQKQVAAVLRALELLLEQGHDDLQVVFFCDIHNGSTPGDVRKLEDLIDRFPDNIATDAFDPDIELLVAAGVDGALMASYFEPFGYAPIWVGMQGGFIITAANGGQVDIFEPDTTFFIDIKPDIDKPAEFNAADWRTLRDRLFISNNAYRRRTFEHNVRSVQEGILAAKSAFQNQERRLDIMTRTMGRIRNLTRSEYFLEAVRENILFQERSDRQAIPITKAEIRSRKAAPNSFLGSMPTTRTASRQTVQRLIPNTAKVSTDACRPRLPDR